MHASWLTLIGFGLLPLVLSFAPFAWALCHSYVGPDEPMNPALAAQLAASKVKAR